MWTSEVKVAIVRADREDAPWPAAGDYSPRPTACVAFFTSLLTAFHALPRSRPVLTELSPRPRPVRQLATHSRDSMTATAFVAPFAR